jgi:hypothetical protein
MDIMNILMLGGLGILVVLLLVMLVMQRKLKKEKQAEMYTQSIFNVKKKRNVNVYWVNLFHIFRKIPVLGTILKKVQRQYDILYPNETRFIKEKSVKLLLNLCIFTLGVMLVVSLMKPDLYFICIAAVLVVVVDMQFITNKVHKEQQKMLQEFVDFMDEVREEYIDTDMIDEAVFNAIDKAAPRVKMHAEEIHRILVSDDMEGEVQKYNRIVPNNYIKLFLVLCVTTIQYGVQKTSEGDSFLDNLKNLKEEIYIDILKNQKINHEFAGATVEVLLPIFAMNFIKSWAVSQIPECDEFYNGSAGFVILVVNLAVTVGIYSFISRMKNGTIEMPDDHWILRRLLEKEWIRRPIRNYTHKKFKQQRKFEKLLRDVGESLTVYEFNLKRFLCGLGALIASICVVNMMNNIQQNNILTSVASLENLANGASDDDQNAMREAVVYYTDYYKYNSLRDKDGNIISEKPFLSFGVPAQLATKTGNLLQRQSDDINGTLLTDNTLNEATMALVIMSDKNIKSSSICKVTAKEVVSRIKKYQSAYFKWWHLLICYVVMYGGFMYPYLMVLYLKKSLQSKMASEVVSFLTIITMLSTIDRMTVQTILEWLELFAEVFRESITECLNNLNQNEDAALEKMEESEEFKMFKKLVQNLRKSDKIGIASAFAETPVERKNYQDQLRQNSEIEIDNKGATAQFLALIPMFCVIGSYLIAPIFLTSTQMLTTQMSSMDELQ